VHGVAQEIIGLYQSLADLIALHGDSHNDEIFARMQFLVSCRYELQQAVLSMLRGHVTDSHLFTRRTIDFAAFAARLKQHPPFAEVWLKAETDDEHYGEYREKFGPKKLFPPPDKELTDLWRSYDQCAKVSHPSINAVARLCAHQRW
jgi:hypothetical protein